ncbi:MAG: hypothetical protein AAFQ41_03145 [Cyanobacteria bacterium J06623_7]
MKITTITYQRKKNLGNYEMEDISLTAEIEEGDNVEAEIEVLKADAAYALGIKPPTPKPVNLEEKPW